MADFVNFRIGGKDVKVPAINLEALERCTDDMKLLSPEMTGFEYARCVLRIVASVLDIDANEIIAHTLAGEVSKLPETMVELLKISGFDMGEAKAAE